MPRTYIILLNWNGFQDTLMCLESVLRLQNADFRIVICDNASTDQSTERLREWATGQISTSLSETPLAGHFNIPARDTVNLIEYDRSTAESGGKSQASSDIVLIHTGGNLGFAGGNNVGIRYALARGDADYVWLLNNDTVIEPDALAHLVARASADSNIGIVGSTLRYFSEPDRVQAYGGCTFNPLRSRASPIGHEQLYRDLIPAEQEQIESKLRYVIGASMLVPRSFLLDIGLMQEDYFLYYEELDWAERARRASKPYTLAFAPKSLVYHKVGASAGTGARSLFSLRYLHMNQLRFMKRFYPHLLPMTRLTLVHEGIKALVKKNTKEARLFLSLAFSTVTL